MTPELRERMGVASIKLAENIGYANRTIEYSSTMMGTSISWK
jgi:hypothetical protein